MKMQRLFLLIPPVALVLAGNVLAGASPDLALNARVDQFAQMAEKAAAPIARVFQDLAVPNDEITLEDDKKVRVVPPSQYLGVSAEFAGKVTLIEIAPDQKGNQLTLTKDQIRAWKPYEESALALVLALREGPEGESLETLQAAQAILVGVSHFHFAHRSRPAAGKNPWHKLEDQLGKELLAVRLDYFKKLAAAAEPKELETRIVPFALQLRKIYPEAPLLKTETGLIQVRRAENYFEEKQYSQARDWLTRSEALLPDHPQVKALRQKLHQAQPPQTGKKLLRVGVKEVPQYLSPALACTEVERQALGLIFESLLTPHYQADLGQHYEPVLAKSLPKVLFNGRGFSLRTDSFWSTGERVALGDLRSTIELLRKSHLSGESFLWTQIVKPAPFTGDPLRFEGKFNQPFFDPLLPFTFKVLPQTYQRKPLASVEDTAFALAPVGSGPFVYQQAETQARFLPNKYHPKAGKSSIGEIVFLPSRDPVAELSDPTSPFHLLLDLTETQVARLKSQGLGKVETLENRRIHFLAVNHRKKKLQDLDLRQALARAIHREQLLDECFRGQDPAFGLLEITGAGPGMATNFLNEKLPQYHHALNGPFPAGSWAVAPKSRVPANLYQADQALLLFRQVKERFQTLTLTLAHPDNDPRIAHACTLMAEQIEQTAARAELDLKIQLRPLTPRHLCEAVHNHDYDLAYYHWDFASQYYWLWPLFDPSPQAVAKKGSNFLGYQNDADLESMLRKRMGYHDFEALKEITHDVHAHLNDHMPLVPLWQLDLHIVRHGQLQTGRLEASNLFVDVTEWKLK